MNDDGKKQDNKSKSAELASWIFGSLLLLFLGFVFVFAPEELPPYKHRQLGFLCALLAGLFAYFFIGTNEIVIKTRSPIIRFIFRGGGGASLFALVLVWWGSPYSLVGVEEKLNIIKQETGKLVEEQERKKTQSMDWLSPHILAFQAYNHIESAFGQDIHEYELIEVLGSYYVCLEPPNSIFHRFPEWTFTFRHKTNRRVVQYQLYDSRVPRPPPIMIPESEINESDIVYYSVLKEEYDDIELRRALEIELGQRLEGNSHSIDIFDIRNLAYKLIGGMSPRDRLLETKDSDRFKVMSRNQALGRAFTYPSTQGLKIQSFTGKYDLRITTSEIKSTAYLNDLIGFEREKWKVDADEAIKIANAKGAVGLAPRQINSPGILRLYYKKGENLNGIYWHIPYILELQYIVINAENGTLFIMKGQDEFEAIN